MAGAEQPPKKRGIAVVVLAILAQFGIIFVIFQAAVIVFLAITLYSCMVDDPIRDAPEVSAFIADRTASERDLATFDALYGLIGDLLTSSAPYGRDVPTARDLRAIVENGSWPRIALGNDARDPLLWVRLAELAEDYLEERTGESWTAVDFSYPFMGGGPVMARRSGSSHTTTRLVCTSGPDRGLYVCVEYYRWDDPARYKDDLDDARARRERRKAYREVLAQLDALEGRTYLAEGDDVFIWSTGDDDPLRDIDAFLAVANAIAEKSDYADVCLLAQDTPVALRYSPYPGTYKNSKPIITLDVQGAYDRLEAGVSAWSLEYARGDVLLRTYRSSRSERFSEEDVAGTLATGKSYAFEDTWHAPRNAVFDEALAQAIARTLGVDVADVIAVVEAARTSQDRSTTYATVVLPRGTVPETPDGFCSTGMEILDIAWDLRPRSDEAGKDGFDSGNPYIDLALRDSICVSIYIVDEDGISDEDGSIVAFDELRRVAREDPAALEEYTVAYVLAIEPYGSFEDGGVDIVFHNEPENAMGPSRGRASGATARPARGV